MVKDDLVGEVDVAEENYGLLELIVIRLGDKETEDQLLGMLTTLLWKKLTPKERMRKLEEEYGIPMHREVVEEVSGMCSYSAAIREQAKEEWLNEGRAEGRAESICILLESVGKLSEDIKAKILAEHDTELLTDWLKLAKKAEMIEEFCVKTGL